ncbi:MAG: S41 family peptidase [Candidatus Pacebacteria bacterium]|nr:S41 family peptidase [Candidatus Paceibacterota bacterium]
MSEFVKKTSFFGGLTALIVVVFVSGMYLGYENRPEAEKVLALLNKDDASVASDKTVDFSPFWKVWNTIENQYAAKGSIDRQKMVWGATQGLVASLGDPYSVFFPPQEAEIFESSVRGDFEGVGMEIGIKKGVLVVVAPIKGSPAEKAGIKTGDQILKIDETTTSDLAVDEAVKLIRGPKGTKVALTIFRENEEESRVLEIERDVIQIPPLETEKKDGGIFVIKLYSFSAYSESSFKQALREMVDSGSSKLIIDLRGNAGGYLESSVDIASWFLPLGKEVVIEEFGTGERNSYSSKGYDIFKNLPLVILVNEGTASASEILAGALQEYGIAKLVGEKTYGKGSVQQAIDIADGSSLKLTIANWLTPNGRSISKDGLEPDVKVELGEADKGDKQMEKAVEIVNNWE